MSPVTNDHQTGLLAQAQRIADEFTLGPGDVQRVTSHFVRQMSEFHTHRLTRDSTMMRNC